MDRAARRNIPHIRMGRFIRFACCTDRKRHTPRRGQMIYAHMTDLTCSHKRTLLVTRQQEWSLRSPGAVRCTHDTSRRCYPHLCCVGLLKTHFLKPPNGLPCSHYGVLCHPETHTHTLRTFSTKRKVVLLRRCR